MLKLIGLSLVLGLTGCGGAIGEPATSLEQRALESGVTASLTVILPTQAAIDWPPKAVKGPTDGEVPDYSEQNMECLDCHQFIMEEETAKPYIKNPHVLHLESSKTAYKGENRSCLTCHEMVTIPDVDEVPPKEGWFIEGDIYHPNVLRAPRNSWSRRLVKSQAPDTLNYVNTLRPADPYTYKPTLKKLVCIECHGPDSKIKTFYGRPDETASN
jgi:nitrate reductase cytochrome c-type subunit